MDAFTGLYHGGPLSGRVFQANTIAVSRDPVALDSWELDLINRVRKNKGYLPVTTAKGLNPDGHPNATFLKNAIDIHRLGNPSLEGAKEYDLTRSSGNYELPSLPKPISFLSAVMRRNNNYEVSVLTDQSNREHVIRAGIKDKDGQIIRNFKTIRTKGSITTLQWDHKNDDKADLPPALYIWQITVDGMVLTGTINDFKI
jgi:hypothetical protein